MSSLRENVLEMEIPTPERLKGMMQMWKEISN